MLRFFGHTDYCARLAHKLFEQPMYAVLYSVGGKEALVSDLLDVIPRSNRACWGRDVVADLLLAGVPMRYVDVIKNAVSARDGARVAELLSEGEPLVGWGLHQVRTTKFSAPLTAEHFVRATRLCDTWFGEGTDLLASLSLVVGTDGEGCVEQILLQFEQWLAQYSSLVVFETCGRGFFVLLTDWVRRVLGPDGPIIISDVRRCLSVLDQALALGAPLGALLELRTLWLVVEWSWGHPETDRALVPWLWARYVWQHGATGVFSLDSFTQRYFDLAEGARDVLFALLSAGTAMPLDDLLLTAEGLAAEH